MTNVRVFQIYFTSKWKQPGDSNKHLIFFTSSLKTVACSWPNALKMLKFKHGCTVADMIPKYGHKMKETILIFKVVSFRRGKVPKYPLNTYCNKVLYMYTV